jgi:hypothetical protein
MFSLVDKVDRCVGLITLHIHAPTVLKSERFNLLELSGALQTCNGMALLLNTRRKRAADENTEY